ncbi:hypothetical protein FRC10_007144 [Ceratobasidium sp. 414]|nr:hypothetical protein FRC10_007144 [Ceratobasidium sp. 414]
MDYTTPQDDTDALFRMHAEKIMEKFYRELGLNAVLRDVESESQEIPAVTRVAVIGAGVSGLQVAMKLGLKHKVDVFEASDRVGGRLYTYKFDHIPEAGEWDYFDVGAMRFPKVSVMASTFKLFEDLRIPLLKYHKTTKESWMYYNNIRFRTGDAQGQDFGASISQGGNVPDDWAKIGYEELMKLVSERFLDVLMIDYEEGYKQLMQYDDHSVRSLMAFVTLPRIMGPIQGKVYPEKKPYPVQVINWLETMTSSAGSFDTSFTEAILDMLAFGEGKPEGESVEWCAVSQGSEKITDAMKKELEDDEHYKKNVAINLCHQATAVVFDPESNTFTLSGKSRPGQNCSGFDGFPEKYSQVVLAISPQAMRYMDLSTCQLDYCQRSSLLMLQPGPSIKVGIKFKSNWWGACPQNIPGGQSATDRPVRQVVYPSHGDGKSTVLIASYCWTQDASVMGALMQGSESFDEERLKNVILRDLADIHDIPLGDLLGEYQAMYAFDWNHDPQTMGAYAFFGPGQFSSLYPNMTRPAAQGRLHFAGEAISTCHA